MTPRGLNKSGTKLLKVLPSAVTAGTMHTRRVRGWRKNNKYTTCYSTTGYSVVIS